MERYNCTERENAKYNKWKRLMGKDASWQMEAVQGEELDFRKKNAPDQVGNYR